MDVALHRHAVVRQLRQIVEVDQRLDRVVDDVLACLPRQAADGVEQAAGAQDVDELQQRELPLRSNHEVHVRRAQHGRRVLGRKIAAPDDRHVRQRRLDAGADGHRLGELRTGHHADGEQRGQQPRHIREPRDDLGGRIGDEVAVDKRPRLRRLEHRGEGHQRQRQRLLPRRRRERVVEDDHRATHRPKAAGARRRRTRATPRRRRQPSGPRDGTKCGRSASFSAMPASRENVR